MRRMKDTPSGDAIALASGLGGDQAHLEALRVSDGAPAGATVSGGDIVMISPNAAVASGDLVVASMAGGGSQVAHYTRSGGFVELRSSSSGPLSMPPLPASQVRVEGKVILVIRELGLS